MVDRTRIPNLTPEMAFEGVSFAFANAERLRIEAAHLVIGGHPSSAIFLHLTRIEELSKAHMLTDVYAGDIPAGEMASFWSRFESHEEKWFRYLDTTLHEVKGWSAEDQSGAQGQSSRPDTVS